MKNLLTVGVSGDPSTLAWVTNEFWLVCELLDAVVTRTEVPESLAFLGVTVSAQTGPLHDPLF